MKAGRGWRIFWLFFLLLVITGCQGDKPDGELNGRITIWHSWRAADAAVLQDVLARFGEIHPNVQVTTVALPEDQILDEYIKAGNDGFGPGLLIGSNNWIGDLVGTGLIRSFTLDDLGGSLFNSRNSALIQYEDQLHGVPLFLAPNALYYNKDLVQAVPESLDELLQEAAAGNHVAFVPRFEEAYWGIQAFGEGLFDDQGRFTLANSGFTEWLSWLEIAQDASGAILNVDDQSLLELFVNGQIAYYVAGPEKQELILDMMDEAASFEFGVVPLPDGPYGPAGPLMPAETILVYAHTSPEQTRIANALAAFLVNPQQSIHFMRELDRVPANPAVRVDNRVYPMISGFSRQTRTAVILPNEIPRDRLTAAGNRAYVTVLSGVATPQEAVCRFGEEVAAFQGYTADDMDWPEWCER